MGSEQSTNATLGNVGSDGTQTRPKSAGPQLQRGYTIAATSDSLNNSQLADSSPLASSSSRPVSPPMSVCSDSDLPYISYTNKPIGGK
jgi:BLOC-1 related complex subunit 5